MVWAECYLPGSLIRPVVVTVCHNRHNRGSQNKSEIVFPLPVAIATRAQLD